MGYCAPASLLQHHRATTQRETLDDLRRQFPTAQVQAGVRSVDKVGIATLAALCAPSHRPGRQTGAP